MNRKQNRKQKQMLFAISAMMLSAVLLFGCGKKNENYIESKTDAAGAEQAAEEKNTGNSTAAPSIAESAEGTGDAGNAANDSEQAKKAAAGNAGKENSQSAGNTKGAGKAQAANGAGQENLPKAPSAENRGVRVEKAADGEAVYVFQDDLGREVKVEKPKRTAALIGSFADIWLDAGGSLAAAANDSWDSLNLPLDKNSVVNLGSITEPDAEKLIAAKPDFVLASTNTKADLALEQILNESGIPAAYFNVSGFDDYLRMLGICTVLTGNDDLYVQNGMLVQQEIARTKERIDGSAPTVLFLRASKSGIKAKGSSGNVGGEIIAGLGGVNIADNNQRLLDSLSMEAIIAADPEFIVMTVQGTDEAQIWKQAKEELERDPAWSSLSAVKAGRVYQLDKRLFNLKPNAKWGQAYEIMADILYPEK